MCNLAVHRISETEDCDFNFQLRRKRDLFGARLIESNIHVGLFKRKIDRIEKVMKTSASDYLNMNNDSYMLKLEIKNLRRKLKNHEMCEFTITTLR